MNREQFIQYISDEYGIDEEYLFAKHPLFCVFRHSSNRKWFAVVMDVPKNKLGLEGADALDVVNLKCDPILIGSLQKEPGIFPAYHMSKAHWVSVALDGSVPDEQIKMLLDMSYDATAPKEKRKTSGKKGRAHMKTIRLLYPDHVSGGLETYYFGAHLLAHILPVNDKQPLIKVDVTPPDGREKTIEDGIYGKSEVISGIKDAKAKLNAENPDKVITIGGNCLVSLAPFDYLHGKYENTGIIWIDAHPDVSTVKDGYPNAHAMVLGSLLGGGDESLTELIENRRFEPGEILYVGLQGLHDYQKKFLDKEGVRYKVQTDSFVSSEEIAEFVKRFDHILIHFDIDVLDEHFFHSTYFANPELSGDGSGGGKMKMDTLADILGQITSQADVVGFTIAEYLPFDEHRLHKMLSNIRLFTE